MYDGAYYDDGDGDEAYSEKSDQVYVHDLVFDGNSPGISNFA